MTGLGCVPETCACGYALNPRRRIVGERRRIVVLQCERCGRQTKVGNAGPSIVEVVGPPGYHLRQLRRYLTALTGRRR